MTATLWKLLCKTAFVASLRVLKSYLLLTKPQAYTVAEKQHPAIHNFVYNWTPPLKTCLKDDFEKQTTGFRFKKRKIPTCLQAHQQLAASGFKSLTAETSAEIAAQLGDENVLLILGRIIHVAITNRKFVCKTLDQNLLDAVYIRCKRGHTKMIPYLL